MAAKKTAKPAARKSPAKPAKSTETLSPSAVEAPPQPDPNDIVMSVDASKVRRAIAFAGTNDYRYYLNGVAVMPSKSGGVLVMASDGTAALCLHDPGGKADKTYILPFNKDKHAKALAERGAMRVEVAASGRIAVTDLFGIPLFIHPGRLIEGKFPDLTSIVAPLDEYEVGLKAAFNPAYLQRALDSADKKLKHPSVCFYSRKEGGDKSTCIFTTHDGFGLVMPLREEPGLSKRLTKDFGGTI